MPDISVASAGSKEKARKSIVKYVFLIYWLLIFEGALRKWAFPQYQQIIFFIRDPIVLWVYILAWRNHIFPQNVLLKSGMLLSLICIPLIFIQLVSSNISSLTLIYGWRMYFYYLPLAFVIKEVFRHEDIHKLIKQTLYVAIPLSILIYAQYISSPTSVINVGYGGGKAFVVSGLTVRTTGTFTFTAGQSFFASGLMAMLLFAWLYRKRYKLFSTPWLLIVTGASMTHLLLSGSRTAFFMTGLIVIATFVGLLFTKDAKSKFTGTILIAFLVLVGAIMFLGPFKDSLDAITDRFDRAEASEGSSIMRALAPLIIFTKHLTTTPIIGYGIGLGTGGGSLLATGKATLVLAEDEWSRVIMEAGPGFGFTYILYRIIFSAVLLQQSIKCAHSENNVLPMILLGFIGFYIFVGQITHQGTIQGYTWIFVGLIMAAAKKQLAQQDLNKSPLPLYPNIIRSSR